MDFTTQILETIDVAAYLEKIDPSLYPTERQLDEAMRQRLYTDQIVLEPLAEDDTVQEGDALSIRTEGGLGKFNREKVPVTVGRDLYDAVLEAALVGLRVGESTVVHTQGETVRATVLGARRKRSQERPVTDEMIAGLGISGVSTIAGYKDWLAGMMSDVGGFLYQKLLPEIVRETAFSPVAAEDAAWVRSMLIEKNYEDWGLTPESEAAMSEEELKERLYGYPGIEARVDGIYGQPAYEDWIKRVLVELQILGMDSGDIPHWSYDTEFELYGRLLKYVESKVRERQRQG